MAKTKQDKKLYSKMRDNGVRKSVAKDLSKLPAHVSGGKQAPKPLRDAIDAPRGRRQGAEGPRGQRRPPDGRAQGRSNPQAERRQPLGVGSQGGAHAREVRHEQRIGQAHEQLGREVAQRHRCLQVAHRHQAAHRCLKVALGRLDRQVALRRDGVQAARAAVDRQEQRIARLELVLGHQFRRAVQAHAGIHRQIIS